MVWVDHDVFKVGLSSGQNDRDLSAVRTIRKYLEHEGAAPGGFIEWRAELPALEGAAWGDCQRFEMVVAAAVKRRLGASAAGAVGLEWLTRNDLQACLVEGRADGRHHRSTALQRSRTSGRMDGVHPATGEQFGSRPPSNPRPIAAGRMADNAQPAWPVCNEGLRGCDRRSLCPPRRLPLLLRCSRDSRPRRTRGRPVMMVIRGTPG